ncbi:MAG TPA: PDZ domain-containing protein [Candidatus Hydrogenedentes bacterium]|nr:PDZ domain-containing protein [Candidatus Hydrogenedentota bacterium]
MIINVLIFLAVLSLLIFFHELGHFAAAKAFGIYVKRFSIGMPPRLFGVQLGETDYCVGLPFGGFVMMAGQEDVPLTDEEREKEYGQVPPERWFKNKPVLQRMCVLLAGPFMNLILAVLLYGFVGLVGSHVPEWEVEARVGEIVPGSPVEEAPLYRLDARPMAGREPDLYGWRIGDRILTINGREAGNITDLAIAAVLGGDQNEQEIVLERVLESGETARYRSPVAPRVLDETGHARFGVGPYETAIVREVLPGSVAEAAGIQKGDVIHSVDGEAVTLSGFVSYIESVKDGERVSVELSRNGDTFEVEAQPRTIGRLHGIWFSADDPEKHPATVAHITPEMQSTTNLRRRDIIIEVNGKPATLEQLRRLQEDSPGGVLHFRVLRPGIFWGLVEPESTFMAAAEVQPVRAIGVVLEPKSVLQRIPVSRVIPHAFYQSYLAVERTLLTIAGLARGTVSPKDLGGPVMIFDVTTKAAEAGFGWLIKITAFISVNLFILNLLPLPVLDGGQVLTNAIEAVRGKPLNEKILERMQQIGIVMLLMLMLFVTYNDVVRLVQGWLPW